MKCRFLLASALLGVMACPAGGQTTARKAVRAKRPTNSRAAANPKSGADADKPAAESPRLTRLKQLQFDRRPSTILKTWAQRPEKKAGSEKPSAEKTKAQDPLDLEVEAFQKHVTLGHWPAVKA